MAVRAALLLIQGRTVARHVRRRRMSRFRCARARQHAAACDAARRHATRSRRRAACGGGAAAAGRLAGRARGPYRAGGPSSGLGARLEAVAADAVSSSVSVNSRGVVEVGDVAWQAATARRRSGSRRRSGRKALVETTSPTCGVAAARARQRKPSTCQRAPRVFQQIVHVMPTRGWSHPLRRRQSPQSSCLRVGWRPIVGRTARPAVDVVHPTLEQRFLREEVVRGSERLYHSYKRSVGPPDCRT